MNRLNTKAARLEYQQRQFETLLAQGYKKEEYKGTVFFTMPMTAAKGIETPTGKFLFKVFVDNAAHHREFVQVNSAERLAEKLQQYKDAVDRRDARKVEAKKEGKKVSEHAQAAAALKAEATAAFPGVKFSVSSDSFAGGDAVRIKWYDGPTYEEVLAIAGKYKAGSFDAMNDIYEYRKDATGPTAKYVQVERHISRELSDACMPGARHIFEQHHYGCNDAANLLFRIFQKTSLPGGVQILGLVETGESIGTVDEFYKITFVPNN